MLKQIKNIQLDGIPLHPVIEAWGDFKEDLIQVDSLDQCKVMQSLLRKQQDIINLDFNTARSNIF